MRVLILGKTGQVGWELQRALTPLGEVVALGRDEADLEDAAKLRAAVVNASPDVIVNAAGLAQRSPFFTTSVDSIARIVQTNLLGTMWGCRMIGKAMLRKAPDELGFKGRWSDVRCPTSTRCR